MKTLLQYALDIVAGLDAVEVPGPLEGVVRHLSPVKLTVLDLVRAVDMAEVEDKAPYYLGVILAAAEELGLDDDEVVPEAVRSRHGNAARALAPVVWVSDADSPSASAITTRR
jgi:hypothetical protein